MSQLFMMVGVPGCGKSRIAQQVAREHDAIVLEADAIRLDELKLGHTFEDTQRVFAEMEQRSVAALNEGKNVVYDATNLRRDNRESFLNRLFEQTEGVSATAIVVDTPLSVCMQRNALREGMRRVPDEILVKMASRFDMPCKDEGFADVVHVDNEANLAHDDVAKQLGRIEKMSQVDKVSQRDVELLDLEQ